MSGGKRKLIRGRGSNPRISNVTRPHDPGGGVGYPVPQNGMMTHGKLRMDINKNRYGKPIQTPSRGAETTDDDRG